ncbi:hypothetical protein BaRGS_00002188 [Batillaria attramentaria]|uniref:Uncharacterized protein n=1 Tax=Batillaria attramentaria TaxID=370345 RepID=A0ABD0M5G9_9CAEN
MPISSGALEWPASFYRKQEEEERGSDAGSLTPVNSPRDYKWQPQLTNRENYEKWRKKMDRKDPLRTRKRKKGNCCDCFGQSKVRTKMTSVLELDI